MLLSRNSANHAQWDVAKHNVGDEVHSNRDSTSISFEVPCGGRLSVERCEQRTFLSFSVA